MGGKVLRVYCYWVREESIGKSGDGIFIKMEFWNSRVKMMGFCIKFKFLF